MAAPQAWSSHIWTEQTLTRLIGSNQQQVEIRTNERMPQSFMVPYSLLTHYCPQLRPSSSTPGQPYVLETTRAILTLFFGWLYTGKVDTTSWYDLTELYFLGHATGCIALMRSAISQLQKACRNDESNHTELFHYEHISVIEEMVGATSPLSRYVEDTYFNHWRPCADDGVNDDPSKHPKSNSLFKKLFERSFQEQRESENCSCCHDYCKYHDHSEAERLATCGRSSAPVVAGPVAEPSTSTPAPAIKPDPVVRTSRKRKPMRRSTISELVPGSDDSVLHETRAINSRSGTPRGKPANETWLNEQSHAPVDYPADYHGLLMSLSEVQSIKPSDWLESGLAAEGINQLPEPDRIIAAAMSWNAEDYAQTKCTFFNQYDPNIRDLSKWLRVLKFGGSKSKEKGERLLAMWGSLGWLDTPAATTNDEMDHRPTPTAPKARTRTSLGASRVRSAEKDASSRRSALWTSQEDDAMMRIMDALEKDPTNANTNTTQRAEMCGQRLKTQFGTDRTAVAINIRYFKNLRDRGAVQSIENTTTTTPINSGIGGSVRNPLSNTPLVARPAGTEFRAINDPICSTAANDDRFDSANPSLIDDSKKRSERWTEREDNAMLEIFKAIDGDANLSKLNLRDRCAECSSRLLSEHGIERTIPSVKMRWKRIDPSNTDTPAKRKNDDVDGPNDEFEPLTSHQKRRQTVSRFVAELYDAEDE